MTISELKEWVSRGSEIEFEYKNIKYSITYFAKKDESWISFCEFYKEPTNVKGVNELLEIIVDGEPLKLILLKLSLDDMYVT